MYIASFRTIAMVDITTNVLVSYSLVQRGDPFLDEYRRDFGRLSYQMYFTRGHEVSPYQPGAAMLAAPVVAIGDLVGIRPPQTESVTVVGKIAGAAATAASAFFVFLSAARIVGRRGALLVTSLYAFGTLSWPVSGGGLWQHGPAQLFLAIGLYQLLSRDPLWRARSGLAFGLATVSRPTAILFAGAAWVTLLFRDRPAAVRFVAWGLPAVAILVIYDIVTFGRLVTRLTPYGDVPAPVAAGGTLSGLFVHDALSAASGILGTLIAPSRGLFLYSPFLALAVYALLRASFKRDRMAGVLRPQLVAFVATVVLYGTSQEWWGGPTYGERYLAEGLPLLAIGIALWLRQHHRRRYATPVLVITGAIGVVISAIGATLYDWVDWSWDRAFPPPASMWRIDIAQPIYWVVHAPERWDVWTAVTIAVCVAMGLLLYRAWSGAAARPSAA